MYEVIEQIIAYLRGIWRYRWYAMLLAWVIVLAGWSVVYRMPDQYQASARVYVDTDSILRPLLRGLAIQPDVRQRLNLMTKTLLSRPNLEKVARMTDLDITAKTPEEMEALLNDLSSDLKLASNRQQPNLYTISYWNRDPQVAKRVVQALLTIFVEDTLGETRIDSDTAQKFLDQQIEEYEARLVEAENRLTEFQRKYMGLLLGGGGDVLAHLQTVNDELNQARLELREAENRREELQRQLMDAEEDAVPLMAAETPLTASIDARIQNLKGQLDGMLLKYTEAHPDVKELRRVIAALEKQKQEELEAMVSDSNGRQSDTNVFYQQLKLALGQTDANLAAMRTRVKEYEGRVEKLQQALDLQPKIEAERKRLNRDYAVNKRNYDALIARRESAKIGEDADQTGDNLQFKVVEPPRVPLLPSGPNRLLLSSGVLLAAVASGLALAFVLSQIRPAIYDGRTLREITGYPVFGAVSRAWTPELLFRKRLEFGGFLSVGILLIGAYGGVLLLHLGTLDRVLQVVRASL